MFPLNNLNFVASALATVSAAVGYRVSRGRTRGGNGNSTASARAASVAATEFDGTEPPTSDCGTPLPASQENYSDEVEEGSLKRKRSASPAATHPEDSAPKRRKTSEPEDRPEAPVKMEEIAPTALDIPCANAAQTSAAEEAEEATQTDACGTAPASGPHNPPAAELETPPRLPSPPPSPVAVMAGTGSPPAFSRPAPAWPSSPSAIVAAKPSSAFQAFSGTSSAFSSAAAGLSPTCPVWSTSTRESSSSVPESDPLAALSYVTSTQTTLTGEEDEESVVELKGVKVFIKRGEREFCEGILGNVKLLKHKENGQERILFRRVPVMKVSMNVRLRPLVRCSFDEGQGQLRVTLMEREEDTQQERVVVYALKRGKASRTEFADFAEAAMESARSLREQLPAA